MKLFALTSALVALSSAAEIGVHSQHEITINIHGDDNCCDDDHHDDDHYDDDQNDVNICNPSSNCPTTQDSYCIAITINAP